MANDELRPRPVPPPSAPAAGYLPPAQLPGEGRPPLRTGEVYMSDYTKEQLKKLGWRPGDPIPGDLGVEIQRIQQQVSQERDAANWEDNPPPGYKKPTHSFVNIDDLPEEEQAKLREYLADYKADRAEAERKRKQEAALATQVAGMSPQMAEVTARAAQQQAEIEMAKGAQMAQAISPAAAPPANIEIPAGKQFGGVFGDAAGIEKISQLQQAAARPQSTPLPVVELGDSPEPISTGELPVFCPRCMWDMREPFEIKPTAEDKEMFVAAILAMDRFYKSYTLFNGNMKIYFRSLLSDEVAKLNEQLAWHVRRGEIMGDGEYFMWLMEYRLCLATARIESGGKLLKDVMTLKQFEAQNPNVFDKARVKRNVDGTWETEEGLAPTALYAMRHWYYDMVVTAEPVRRVIGQQHRVFQRLVEGLEALADQPDFWSGIGQPA